MVRVVRGSLVVETCKINYDQILWLFKKLYDEGLVVVDVAIYPSYVYARRLNNHHGIYQYGVSPLSLILPSEYQELVKDIKYVYVVERDAWIDVKRLNLDVFLKAYDAASRLVKSVELSGEKPVEFETEKVSILFKRAEWGCDTIIYLDSVNAHYGGVFHRIDFTDEAYLSILKDHVERRPGEYVLSYVVSSGRFYPLLTYNLKRSKPIAVYLLPQGCDKELFKYVAASLIDLLLT